jgi:hypothetical protein
MRHAAKHQKRRLRQRHGINRIFQILHMLFRFHLSLFVFPMNLYLLPCNSQQFGRLLLQYLQVLFGVCVGFGFGRGLLALVFENVGKVGEKFQRDEVTLGVDFLLLLPEDK